VIDSLAVRVPHDAPFNPNFAALYEDLLTANTFRPAKHYERVADLRRYGYSMNLHLSCVRDQEGNHKIELLDTGERSFPGLVHEIESVFDLDALELDTMRVDLAVDVPHVPVTFFQQHARVTGIQYQGNYACSDLREMGKGGIQTLYFGKRPNLYRVYDKVAEYHVQYRRFIREANRGGPVPELEMVKETPLDELEDLYKASRDASAVPPPSFEEKYGIPENGYVLTRVERQMGGNRIPPEVATVGKLQNAHQFCPFDAFEIFPSGLVQPNPQAYKFEMYGTGMHIRHLAETIGMQATIAFVRKHTNGNGKKVIAKYRDFFPPSQGEDTLTTARLNGMFMESMARQLLTSHSRSMVSCGTLGRIG